MIKATGEEVLVTGAAVVVINRSADVLVVVSFGVLIEVLAVGRTDLCLLLTAFFAVVLNFGLRVVNFVNFEVVIIDFGFFMFRACDLLVVAIDTGGAVVVSALSTD